MEDEVLYELGVDIGSAFQFHDGDLKIAQYDENLVQAVANKLNTNLDELDLFYEDYGSVISSFLGWKATDETIGFIKAELETVLKTEPRLFSWNYEVKYIGNGNLTIDLVLNPNPSYSISTTFEINENGVEVVD